MSQFLLILFIGFCYLLYLGYQKLSASKVDYAAKLEEAYKSIGELENQLKFSRAAGTQSGALVLDLQKQYTELRHQKISADVKLGQKFEVLLPFLDQFPYPNDEIKGLYQPLDLIVFREEEVVFCELKSGESQLSEKQRRIRDNIQAGRVRFEMIRLNEKGITVK